MPLLNRVLIAIPTVNVYGAAISTLCCFASICVLDVFFIRRCFGEYPHLGRILGRPLVSTAVMGVAAVGAYKVCSLVLGTEPGRLMMLMELAVAILAAVIVYFVMVIVTRSITAEDLKLIPKGEKIAKLLKMS